jgi:HPt (histidine-containing phosphotransfer) domain-containing protein
LGGPPQASLAVPAFGSMTAGICLTKARREANQLQSYAVFSGLPLASCNGQGGARLQPVTSYPRHPVVETLHPLVVKTGDTGDAPMNDDRSVAPDGSPIQLDVALRRVDGDAEFLEELVRTFHEELPERLHALREAIRSRDHTETARSAHRLKGSLGVLAAERARTLAHDLETLAGTGRLDDAARVCATLEQETVRITAFFNSPDWKKRLR